MMKNSNKFILDFKINIPQFAELGNLTLIEYQKYLIMTHMLNCGSSNTGKTLKSDFTEDMMTIIESNLGTDFNIVCETSWVFFKTEYITCNETVEYLNACNGELTSSTFTKHITQFMETHIIDPCEIAHHVILNEITTESRLRISIKHMHLFNNFMMLSSYYERKFEAHVNNLCDRLNGFNVNAYLQNNPYHFWALYLLFSEMTISDINLDDFLICDDIKNFINPIYNIPIM